MSSDYYGSIAGEIADRGAQAEAAFLEWEDAYARREPARQLRDDFRAAFMAGYELRGTTLTAAEAEARCFWIIAVSPDGRADPESGPDGPFTFDEAARRAHQEPDPLSGWRELILAEHIRGSDA